MVAKRHPASLMLYILIATFIIIVGLFKATGGIDGDINTQQLKIFTDCSREGFPSRTFRLNGPLPFDALPEAVQRQFTMDGAFPLKSSQFLKNDEPGHWSVGQVAPGFDLQVVNNTSVWTDEAVEFLLERTKAGIDVGPADYPQAALLLVQLLKTHSIAGAKVAVLGSISPWIEVVVLSALAKEVTTFDYNPPISEHPRLQTKAMSLLPDHLNYFDVVISYSAIEHDGLGRYGDPIDPDGDVHAMAEIRSITKPGGKLLLGIPVGAGGLYFNAHRLYNPDRFGRLLQGWKYIGAEIKNLESGKLEPRTESWKDIPVWVGQDWKNHPWFILKKA